jgi:hypothetical protein
MTTMAPRKSQSSTEQSVTYESEVLIKKEKIKYPKNYADGPAKFKRNSFGLLDNVDYTFSEDGSVNWRSMIKDEHLFPNKSWFDMRRKDVPRTIDGLGDHQLLIKLSGIKELAKLRGFSDVAYEVVKCEPDHVAVICRVTFLPNYETGGKAVVFQDMANATLNNTSNFATKFLETIACNRAFVRCVRNFLNVHIVGDDEIDKSSSPAPTASVNMGLTPSSMVENLAKEKLNCSNFEEFRVILRDWWKSEKYKNDSVKDWNQYEDIPASQARILMKLINI